METIGNTQAAIFNHVRVAIELNEEVIDRAQKSNRMLDLILDDLLLMLPEEIHGSELYQESVDFVKNRKDKMRERNAKSNAK